VKRKKHAWRGGAGVLLLLLGGALSYFSARPYTERHYVVDAGACRMNVTALERRDPARQPPSGAVVLLHGLSANKIIMGYLARAFAELGLRVYIPDLPGHGRSPGPFTPARAESCATALVRGLAARGMVDPRRTILAGHSMGAAIALRIAEKLRPAGVIAISPAPMSMEHGVPPETLLFTEVPQVLPNTLILIGQYEPKGLQDNARDLAKGSDDPQVRFDQMQGNSHVSLLFSPSVAREAQQWAARVLSLPPAVRLPFRGNVLGSVLGLLGMVLLAGPFLRELVGEVKDQDRVRAEAVATGQAFLEVFVVSMTAIFLLRYGKPLGMLKSFEGDYLASFFLLTGLGMILLHVKRAANLFRGAPGTLLGAGLGGFLLFFLSTGWLELTVTSAWLTLERWTRFPLFFLAVFLFLYGLELLWGPAQSFARRYVLFLALVALAWLALTGGVLYLKSGEILLVLLAPYFALLFLVVGLGIHLVRQRSGDARAAALFGAILLAGFCLVLFPVS